MIDFQASIFIEINFDKLIEKKFHAIFLSAESLFFSEVVVEINFEFFVSNFLR